MSTRRYERRWLWSWIGLALLVTTVPYVLAASLAPAGSAFLGSLLNTDDTAQFLAAMRQGMAGSWLYRNPFTPEVTRPVLMYPLYMLWGKLIGWTGIDLIVGYHLLRLIGALLLLLVLAKLAQTLVPDGARQYVWRSAFLLAAFSSGFGWLAAFLPRRIGMELMADLALIEFSTFQSYYVVPHFAWGLMFELLTLLCYLRAIGQRAEPGRFWRWSLGGGLACLGMGLVYPFALVVVSVVLGTAVVLSFVTRRAWTRAALWSAAAILGLAAPLVVYYAVIFGVDPIWHTTHVIGNTTGSPPVWSTAFGYGLVLILAVAGAVWALRKRRWEALGAGFVVSWAVVQGLLPYVPVSFQGRFAAGWHVALAILAALGLEWWGGRFPARAAQRVRNVAVILTLPSTLLILLAGPYMAVTQGGYPFYLARDELQAMQWLAGHIGEHDVVLASYVIGNTLPTRAGCRVFVGHQFESYQLADKLSRLRAFFDADTSDGERQAMLCDYGVTWLYYGRFERQMGSFDPSVAVYLKRAYNAHGITIYAVSRD